MTDENEQEPERESETEHESEHHDETPGDALASALHSLESTVESMSHVLAEVVAKQNTPVEQPRKRLPWTKWGSRETPAPVPDGDETPVKRAWIHRG